MARIVQTMRRMSCRGLCLATACMFLGAAAGTPGDPTVAWDYDTQELVMCSPAVGDLDSLEPGSEIVIGNRDDGVYCLSSDGRLLWCFQTGQRFFHPAIANIDGQGSPEVLIHGAAGADGGHVYCLNSDGTQRWAYKTGHEYYYPAGLTIANIDTAEYPEILAGSGSDLLDSLYCLNFDGTRRWSFPTLSHAGSPVVADIDEEGTPEVVFARQGAEVYCLDSDGNTMWTRNLDVSWAAVPSIADVDLDGDAEIVLSGCTIGGVNVLYCLENDGTLKWTAELLDSASGGLSMAAIDDIDSDARPEIVVFSNCYDDARDSLYALQDDGAGARVVWAAKADDWMGASSTSPVICDLDRDGYKEVVWHGSEYLRIYSGLDGDVTYENPDFHCATTQEHPAIADIDGDGHAEIVAPYRDTEVAVLRCDDWAMCRDQFSSYTYHITNINDNLTIPRIEPHHWDTHNSWLAQRSLQIHDVGMVSIDSPPDTVDVGSSHPILVRVANFGDYTESFDVEYLLAQGGIPVWLDTVSVPSLPAQDTTQISFGDLICSDTTTWRLSFTTLLLDDQDRSNDTMSQYVFQVYPPGVRAEPTRDPPPVNPWIRSSPNPFGAGGIVISFNVERLTSNVSLKVYDLSGRVIRTLVDNEPMTPSSPDGPSGPSGNDQIPMNVVWDGRDDEGNRIPSGVYFCRLIAGDYAGTKKLVLLR